LHEALVWLLLFACLIKWVGAMSFILFSWFWLFFYLLLQVLVICRCSAYGYRAWHSYESWFNIATTDGCYGAEKGTSWWDLESREVNYPVKVTISAAFMLLLFCTCMLDPGIQHWMGWELNFLSRLLNELKFKILLIHYCVHYICSLCLCPTNC